MRSHPNFSLTPLRCQDSLNIYFPVHFRIHFSPAHRLTRNFSAPNCSTISVWYQGSRCELGLALSFGLAVVSRDVCRATTDFLRRHRVPWSLLGPPVSHRVQGVCDKRNPLWWWSRDVSGRRIRVRRRDSRSCAAENNCNSGHSSRLSCPPKSLLANFSACVHIALHFHLFAASSASHTPICVCCRTPLRAMLQCNHSSTYKDPQSFHSSTTVEASCIMQ